MTLGNEKLDVYRLSIGYVAWVYEKAGALADRMAAMLSQLGGRGYQVQEDHAAYGETGASDPDPDSDFDSAIAPIRQERLCRAGRSDLQQ